MACCLTAPSHYLNQWWLISNRVLHNCVKDKGVGNDTESNHYRVFAFKKQKVTYHRDNELREKQYAKATPIWITSIPGFFQYGTSKPVWMRFTLEWPRKLSQKPHIFNRTSYGQRWFNWICSLSQLQGRPWLWKLSMYFRMIDTKMKHIYWHSSCFFIHHNYPAQLYQFAYNYTLYRIVLFSLHPVNISISVPPHRRIYLMFEILLHTYLSDEKSAMTWHQAVVACTNDDKFIWRGRMASQSQYSCLTCTGNRCCKIPSKM